MAVRRRISATFKDLPGGQVLGPTFDYTHRLLDFSLLEDEARGEGGRMFVCSDSDHCRRRREREGAGS